jgi:hypothetical protein
MEVHSPHQSIHTWRDFFIHIATIVVGLLIAVGLEQGVEALHHRHQRHQLEEDIRAEAERNVTILQKHLDVNIPAMLSFRETLTAVRTAPAKEGWVDLTLPGVRNNGGRGLIAPERNVFPVAKSSGTIALLPETEAQAYARVDFESEEDEKMVDQIRVASAAVNQFELATGGSIRAGASLHLTEAQREKLVEILALQANTLFRLLDRDNLYLNDCKGIASGIHDVDTLNRFRSEQPLIVPR